MRCIPFPERAGGCLGIESLIADAEHHGTAARHALLDAADVLAQNWDRLTIKLPRHS